MESTSSHKGQQRPASTKADRVNALLAKTIESGATPEEEMSSVKAAHRMIDGDGELDFKDFTFPPRFTITSDGFLIPATVTGGAGSTRAVGVIRKICEDMLLLGKSGADIVAEVKRQQPGAKTTTGCVSWYKAKMVKRAKEAGRPNPFAHLKAAPEAAGAAAQAE